MRQMLFGIAYWTNASPGERRRHYYIYIYYYYIPIYNSLKKKCINIIIIISNLYRILDGLLFRSDWLIMLPAFGLHLRFSEFSLSVLGANRTSGWKWCRARLTNTYSISVGMNDITKIRIHIARVQIWRLENPL